MMQTNAFFHSIRTFLFALGGLLALASRGAAQMAIVEDPALLRMWDTSLTFGGTSGEPATTASNRVPRLHLFRIAPGFLADPIGMQDDDFELPGVAHFPTPSTAAVSVENSGTDWIQFGMGADNPYLDLRRPGDPGGFGYYRVNSQLTLFDSPTTSCSIGVQAVTPTGAQFGGLPNGPTVFSPSFGIFHAVNDRLALQGFLSKNMPLNEGGDIGTTPIRRNFQYGVAVQHPLITDGPETLRSLFFSFGALGQFASSRDSLHWLPNYDMLPGLIWHLNDSWWVSSAVLLPLGPVRAAPGQWQLTCAIQF
jgi:hypothetical protein